MGRATVRAAAILGFSALMAFQIALAAGAPLGHAAWGGSHADLTTGQRVGSAVSAGFYILAIFIVRGRAAGRLERRYRWGTWALVVILALSALMNVASDSRWESFLMAPVALVLTGLCLRLARARTAVATDGRFSARRRRPLPG